MSIAYTSVLGTGSSEFFIALNYQLTFFTLEQKLKSKNIKFVWNRVSLYIFLYNDFIFN